VVTVSLEAPDGFLAAVVAVDDLRIVHVPDGPWSSVTVRDEHGTGLGFHGPAEEVERFVQMLLATVAAGRAA
jgi:hypothetical protein